MILSDDPTGEKYAVGAQESIDTHGDKIFCLFTDRLSKICEREVKGLYLFFFRVIKQQRQHPRYLSPG